MSEKSKYYYDKDGFFKKGEKESESKPMEKIKRIFFNSEVGESIKNFNHNLFKEIKFF